uniref:Angiotensin-converting enzyme n=1 Tax=Plectus sambesii TaxID=2011161 RepID=A0A914UH19_9BILA
TFYTNTTDYNAQQAAIADANFGVWQLKQAVSAQAFDSSQIQNAMVNRQLTSIKTVGINLTSDDTQKLSTLINNMNNIFSNSRICPFGNPSCNTSDPSQSWALDPDLSNIMAYNQSSGDYDLQTYVWNEWRKKTQPIKDIYPQFVNLSNKGAQQGGFADTGAWWRSWYNTEDPNYNFQQAIDNLFMQVLPLYEELHTYVRRQLRQHYPNRFSSSAIPAHILGNMWAQEWQNIFSITQPFPNKTSVDVTQAMIDQNYTPLRMFQTADKFFQSLGLTPMVDAFWNGTIMTKPTNVEGFVCHASAWDFFNRVDFRIKMCTQVRMEDLITIHHEMGHIQYFMQYSVQPVTFRNGANPGFHEAIGDTIALSVATPTHLQKIGLLANYISDTQQDINFLYKQALEKVAFLPFGYLIDQWRWQVFSGQTTPDQYNADWWKLRTQYQGIVPPVDRPDNAFDPAAKSHIDDNTPYIRYFISYVAQFQFYKAMCQAANHTGPLYTCDFYNNTNAGAKLASMLRLGNSVPWNVAMNTLTGQPNIDASAILEYFKPLKDWLHSENLKAGDCYGWGYAWDDQTLHNHRINLYKQHNHHTRCIYLYKQHNYTIDYNNHCQPNEYNYYSNHHSLISICTYEFKQHNHNNVYNCHTGQHLETSTSNLTNFKRLMFRWRGSIWQCVWKDLLIWLILYAMLSCCYRFILSDSDRGHFEDFVHLAANYTSAIPLTFMLGFYVSLVLNRWWEIFMNIAWPDNIAISIATYVQGNDESARIQRRTIVRYLVLAEVLVLRDISSSVKKRFPSLNHVVNAGLMTEEEQKMIESISINHAKYWMPIEWCCTMLRRIWKRRKLEETHLHTLVEAILQYRGNLGMLMAYDWISVPLVYTQVANLSILSYFGLCLLSSQYVAEGTESASSKPKLSTVRIQESY